MSESQEVYGVARTDFLQMLEERNAVGVHQYGATLHTHNGRDAFQDAAEEVVDLWQYLTQARLERDDLRRQNAELRKDRIALRTTVKRQRAELARLSAEGGQGA